MTWNEAQNAMRRGGVHLGDLLWWTLQVGRIQAAALAAAWTAQGLPADKLPEAPTDARAFKDAASKVRAEAGAGYRVDKAPDPDDRPAFAIFSRVDDPAASTGFRWEPNCRIVLLPDGTLSYPVHPIAASIDREYQALRGTHDSADVRRAIVRTLESLSAALVREAGGIYWVAPQHCGTVRALANAIGTINGSTVDVTPIHDPPPETVKTYQKAAAGGIEADLSALRAEIDAIGKDEKFRAGTLARKLERCEDIRQKAALYRSVLSVEIADLDSSLATLESDIAQIIAGQNGGKA